MKRLSRWYFKLWFEGAAVLASWVTRLALRRRALGSSDNPAHFASVYGVFYTRLTIVLIAAVVVLHLGGFVGAAGALVAWLLL